MIKRILPLLALFPFAACEDIEAGLDAPPPTEAAPVQVAATPAARPTPVAAVATPRVATTPISAAPVRAPAPAPAGGNLAPPPAAEGIAVGEPNPAAPTPVSSTAATGALGTTVASLGTTDPGLWLETPLVSAPTQGTVEYNGETVSVELRPSGGEPGSGSQISLEAMRALGAPLTGLPELTVYGG